MPRICVRELSPEIFPVSVKYFRMDFIWIAGGRWMSVCGGFVNLAAIAYGLWDG